ncbi:thioesterase [Streptomyces sp. A7024]|uniref:Thioesterase n=1 Tax=Streptomyces coryli TaxID=1128680 RepID=A0A6G4TUE9_9ACTN|nr:alpha/beta fold hydrolase [Streptomyces coryli]NGN63433.1 thioesterase [Streptomyces coryli]
MHLTAGQQWWAPLTQPLYDRDRLRARLLVLPHSGGGPNRYRELVAGLPEDFEVLGLTLPGRERRLGEPLGAVLDDVIGSLDEIHRNGPPLPTVIFGHSLGAGLGLHLAHALGPQCHALVASAQAPQERVGRRPDGTDDDLLSILERSDANVPPEILEDDEWRATVLRTLRADLRLGIQAAGLTEGIRIAAPITVLCGREDRLIPLDQLTNWRTYTSGPCEVTLFPGGHFALFDAINRQSITGVLEQHLTMAAADAGYRTATA